MNEEIRAQAERQLAALREARGLTPHPPVSLGRIFAPTPGVPLHDGRESHLLPMPCEEWAAAEPPWDDEGPLSVR